MNLNYSLQFIEFLFRRGPAGHEAADGVVPVSLSEVGEHHFAPKLLCLLVVENHKLLVGGRVYIEFKSFANKDVLHPHSHLDGVL